MTRRKKMQLKIRGGEGRGRVKNAQSIQKVRDIKWHEKTRL